MTDEELEAEKYVRSVIDVNAFDWKIVREIALAYLAGLKAGKSQWHKVADGDLPKVKTWVIGFYYGKDNWHKLFYRADGNWWGEGQLCQPPITWCEIPKFEETVNEI